MKDGFLQVFKVGSQGWTNLFLGARSGTQKMGGQNQSVRRIKT